MEVQIEKISRQLEEIIELLKSPPAQGNRMDASKNVWGRRTAHEMLEEQVGRGQV